MANKNAVRLGGAYVEITANNSKLVQGLKESESQLKSFTTEMQNVSATMTAFGAGIVVPLKKATDYFGEFEKQMLITKVVSRASEKELEQMTRQAKELGATTSWTARQVAEGMASLGRMGFDDREIRRTIASVMDLGRALDVDVNTAAKELGSVMRQFGAKTYEAGHYADVLAKATNSASMEMSELYDTMKYVGSVGNAINMDVESVLALVAALRDAGATASQAGTQLRSIFLKFQTPKNVQIFADKFGVDIKDANGRLKSFVDIAIEAQRRARALGDDISSVARKMFGTLQAPGYINLLKATRLEEFRDELYECDGAARDFRETMESGVFGATQIGVSAVEAITNQLGEGLAPTVKEVRDILIAMSVVVRKFMDEHRPLISLIAKTGLAFGTLGPALLSVVGVFKTSTMFMRLLGTASNKLVGAWRSTSSEARALKKETARLNAEMARLKTQEAELSSASAPFNAIETAAEAAAISVANLNAQLAQASGAVASVGRVSGTLFHKYNEGDVSFNSTSYLVGGGERQRYNYDKTKVDERTVMVNGRSFKEDRAAAGEEFKERETNKIRAAEDELRARNERVKQNLLDEEQSRATTQRAVLNQAHYEEAQRISAGQERAVSEIDEHFTTAHVQARADEQLGKKKLDEFYEQVSSNANKIEQWEKEQTASAEKVVAVEKERVAAIQESIEAENFTSDDLNNARKNASKAYKEETKGIEATQRQILSERKTASVRAQKEFYDGLRNLFGEMSGSSYTNKSLKEMMELESITNSYLKEGGASYRQISGLKYGSYKEAADAYDKSFVNALIKKGYDDDEIVSALRHIRGKEPKPLEMGMVQGNLAGLTSANVKSIDGMWRAVSDKHGDMPEHNVIDRAAKSPLEAAEQAELLKLAEAHKAHRKAFLAPYKIKMPATENAQAFTDMLNNRFDANRMTAMNNSLERYQEASNKADARYDKARERYEKTSGEGTARNDNDSSFKKVGKESKAGRAKLTDADVARKEAYNRLVQFQETYDQHVKEGGAEKSFNDTQNKYLKRYQELLEERAKKQREAATLREGEYAANNTVMVNAATKRDTAYNVAQRKYDASTKYRDTVQATNAVLKEVETVQEKKIKTINDVAARLHNINAANAKSGITAGEQGIKEAQKRTSELAKLKQMSTDSVVSVYSDQEKANDARLKENLKRVDQGSKAAVTQITQNAKEAQATLHATANGLISNVNDTVKAQSEAVARESTSISLHGGVGKTTDHYTVQTGGQISQSGKVDSSGYINQKGANISFAGMSAGEKASFLRSTAVAGEGALASRFVSAQGPGTYAGATGRVFVEESHGATGGVFNAGSANARHFEAVPTKPLVPNVKRTRVAYQSALSDWRASQAGLRNYISKFVPSGMALNDVNIGSALLGRSPSERAEAIKLLGNVRERRAIYEKAFQDHRAALKSSISPAGEYAAAQGLNATVGQVASVGTSARDISAAVTEATKATQSFSAAAAQSGKAAGQLATVTSSTATATHSFVSETKKAVINGQLYTVETNNATAATNKLSSAVERTGKSAKIASGAMHALSFAAKGLGAVAKFFGGMVVTLAAWQAVMVVFEKIASFAKQTAENMEKASKSNDELINKDIEATDKAYSNIETDEQKIDQLVSMASSTEPVTAQEKKKLDALYNDLAKRGIINIKDIAGNGLANAIVPDENSPTGYRVTSAGSAEFMKARALDLQLPELQRQESASKFDVFELDPSKFDKFTEIDVNDAAKYLEQYKGMYEVLSSLTPKQRDALFGKNSWWTGRFQPFGSKSLFEKVAWDRTKAPQLAKEALGAVKEAGPLSKENEANLQSLLRHALTFNEEDYMRHAGGFVESNWGGIGFSFLQALNRDQGQGFIDTYKKLQEFGASSRAIEDVKSSRDALIKDAKEKSSEKYVPENAEAKAEAKEAAEQSAVNAVDEAFAEFKKKIETAELTPAQRQLQELEEIVGDNPQAPLPEGYEELKKELGKKAREEVDEYADRENKRLNDESNKEASEQFATVLKQVRGGKLDAQGFIDQYNAFMKNIPVGRDMTEFYSAALSQMQSLVSATKATIYSTVSSNAYEFADLSADVVLDVQRQQLDQLRTIGAQARMIYSWMINQDEYKDVL